MMKHMLDRNSVIGIMMNRIEKNRIYNSLDYSWTLPNEKVPGKSNARKTRDIGTNMSASGTTN